MINLRRFEVQAKLSVGASIVGLVMCLLMIPMVFRYLQPGLMIYYNPESYRMLMILVMGGLAGVFGCVGFGLGFNSAAQRRNERSSLSWLGFFLGAAAMCIAILLLAIFWFWKETVSPS
jgi:hypothetical protein